jgi:hypothetical protein
LFADLPVTKQSQYWKRSFGLLGLPLIGSSSNPHNIKREIPFDVIVIRTIDSMKQHVVGDTGMPQSARPARIQNISFGGINIYSRLPLT